MSVNAEDMDALRRRVTQMLPTSGPSADPELERALGDLRGAYEELLVADEELAAQQQEIARLRDVREVLRGRLERTLAVLPVAVILTDGQGMVQAVNAPAAIMAGSRPARMVGKPVFSLVAVDDRRPLRLALVGPLDGLKTFRHRATVHPRTGDPGSFDVTVTVSSVGSAVEATWTFLPVPAPAGRSRALDLVGAALGTLVAIRVQSLTPGAVLTAAANACRAALGPQVELSIVLGPPMSPEALATTGRHAQRLDGTQMHTMSGPSVSAHETGRPIRSDDLGADERWPALEGAPALRPTACVAVPIEVAGRTAGVFTAYAPGGAIAPWQQETVELLSSGLSAVLHELEVTSELDRASTDMKRALASRSTIEQAKGIVMRENRIGPDEAFTHLVELSSRQERKLRDVAREIVDRQSRP